ncbi:MAG: hypothetical protein ACRC2T_20490 [Thermoguttaceae bacterium]
MNKKIYLKCKHLYQIAINWLTPDESGPTTIFGFERMAGLVRIQHDLPNTYRDLLMVFEAEPCYDTPTIAHAGFLNENIAPFHLMVPGRIFYIITFRERKEVIMATGVVLGVIRPTVTDLLETEQKID